MQLLRERYRIPRIELGLACGLSVQRIHEIETGENRILPATKQKLLRGWNELLSKRKVQISALEADLKKHADTLLDYVEESEYEL